MHREMTKRLFDAFPPDRKGDPLDLEALLGQR
jgi:hypothetical protein